MSNKIYFYPVWIRLWHVLNALLFLVLIVTGLSMQFASKNGSSLITFVTAVRVHNFCGILLTINYLFFFIFNLVTGNWKFYKIKFEGFIDRMKKQMMYYSVGIFKGENPPFPLSTEQKFNPLQQFTYVFVMYFVLPLLAITGWAMLFPQVVVNQIFGYSGLFLTDSVHALGSFIAIVFMVVHVYFCTIGATVTSNFKGMVNGWHEAH